MIAICYKCIIFDLSMKIMKNELDLTVQTFKKEIKYLLRKAMMT